MKKTLTITLNGIIFNIEEDGYNALKTYLDSIRDYFSDHGGEVLSDIEARAAEKFSEKISATNQVVSMADIEELIRSMGTIEDIAGEEKPETSERAEKGGWMKKTLYRDTNNAVIMGVASGIANYFGIDPVLVRLAFVATLFFGGVGVLIYLVLCFIVPEAKTTAQKMEMNGQPINLSSLKEAAEEKIAETKEKLSSAHPIRRSILVIAPIAKNLVRLLAVLIGLSVIIAAVFALVGISFIFGNLIFNANSPYIDFPLKDFLSGINYYLVMAAGFVTAFIPVLLGFLIGVSFIKKRLIMNLTAGLALLMFWIISLTTLGICAIRIAPQYEERLRSIENTQRSSQGYEYRDFNSIMADGDYEINIEKGDGYKIEASGFSQDLSTVEIVFYGGELKITEGERNNLCVFCFYSHRKVTVDITMPGLTGYAAEGIVRTSIKGFEEEKIGLDLQGSTRTIVDIDAKSATVELGGVAKLGLSGSFDDMAVTLGDSSRLEATDLSVKNMQAGIDGAAKLDLAGSSDSMTATLSDSSDLKASGFSVKKLKINTDRASSARVWATERLDITSKDSSKIYYKGDPEMTKDIDRASLLVKEN